MTTLMPRAGGRYLSPIEVIRRVGAAFAYVETSTEGARKHVLEWMNQLAFVSAEGRSAAHNDYLAQLEGLEEAAFFLHFGDDVGNDGALFSMLLIPHQPLVIEHSSELQKAEIPALIARCAAALDYEIVEQRNVEEKAGPELPRSALGCATAV